MDSIGKAFFANLLLIATVGQFAHSTQINATHGRSAIFQAENLPLLNFGGHSIVDLDPATYKPIRISLTGVA